MPQQPLSNQLLSSHTLSNHALSNKPSSDSASLDRALESGNVWQARHTPEIQSPVISTGYKELDEQLPAGGWQAGLVCEMYHQALGAGELSLLLPALAQLSQQPKWILWVAPPAIPYAPALKRAGVELNNILVVRPKSYKEAIWCLEEGIRSGHCIATLGWLSEWHKTHIRRIQIAAADFHTHCWLWPPQFDSSGSPAAIRIGVRRLSATQLEVECFKRRGRWPGKPFNVDLTQSAIKQA
ncbi:MAG: translesion DNA synthesis-associated protein ImuA [Oceanobacter sp.]